MRAGQRRVGHTEKGEKEKGFHLVYLALIIHVQLRPLANRAMKLTLTFQPIEPIVITI